MTCGPDKIDLSIRCVGAQIAHSDRFHNDRHPDPRANYFLANPPFNAPAWGVSGRPRTHSGAMEPL